jgi:hypothetical protein
MKIGRNYIQIGRYVLANNLWDDGGIIFARDKRIVLGIDFPTWAVNLYCRLVARW